MAAARSVLAIALLAGPTGLAFFSGGYFERVRLWSGIATFTALALAAVVSPRPLPRSGGARICLAGLAGLAVWSALSIAWAPVRDAALADAERVALYAGYLAAAAAVFGEPRIRRLIEPLLLAGAAVVAGYGIATRVLPELVESSPGVRAGNRLDQPLTYWNAVGALAAMALVLAAGLAADDTRRRSTRCAAAASVPVLALTLYLTLSRGAVAALAAGAVVLLALAVRRREAVGTAVLTAATGAVTVAVASKLPAVERVGGVDGAHDRQRVTMLVVLVAASAAAAAGQAALARHGAPRARFTAAAAAVAAALALALLAVPSARTPASAQPNAIPARDADGLPTTPARLRTLETNRPHYWKAALATFADNPLKGVGAHGFAVEWLERRTIPEAVQDAHSLYLETPAELGVVGLALLACFLGGLAACVRRLPRNEATVAIAAGSVFLVHAGFDWGWEMPALTGVFLALAAAVVARSEVAAD